MTLLFRMDQGPLRNVRQRETAVSMLPAKMSPERVCDRAAVVVAAKLVNSARKSQTKKFVKKSKLSLKRSVNTSDKKSTSRKLVLGTDSSLNDTADFKDCPSMTNVSKTEKKRDESKYSLKDVGNKLTHTQSLESQKLPGRDGTAGAHGNECFSCVSPYKLDALPAVTWNSKFRLRRCSVCIERLELPSNISDYSQSLNLSASGTQKFFNSKMQSPACQKNDHKDDISGSVVMCTKERSDVLGKNDAISSDTEDVSLLNEDGRKHSLEDKVLSRSFHTCPTCGDRLQRGCFVQHIKQCLEHKETIASDGTYPGCNLSNCFKAENPEAENPAIHERSQTKDGGEEDILQTDDIFCQICQKDLSRMSSHRHIVHINRCIDQEEAAKQEEEKKKQALEAAKTQVLDCPMCGKVLRTSASRKNHLKNCASSLGVETERLLKLIQQQKEEHLARLAAGILPAFCRSGQGLRQQDSAGRQNRLAAIPKSKFDEDTQLALALSSSLNPEASSLSASGEGTSKRGRKQQQDEDYLLHKLTSSQAAARIAFRVSDIITQQDEEEEDIIPALPLVQGDSLWTECVHQVHLSSDSSVFPGKTFWGQTSLHDTDSARKPAGDPRLHFYVPMLMPPVQISTVVVGSKVRRMSEIPGRRRSFDAKIDIEQGQNEGGDYDSERDDHPSPSTQTAVLLAEMAAEADEQSWSEHHLSVSQRQAERDLLTVYASLVNQSDYSDLTIKAAEGTTLFAHRVILSVRCPALLGLADSVTGEADLMDWTLDCVLAVLRFVYAGITDFDADILPDVLSLAERLRLMSLMQMVRELMHLPDDKGGDDMLPFQSSQQNNAAELRRHVTFDEKDHVECEGSGSDNEDVGAGQEIEEPCSGVEHRCHLSPSVTSAGTFHNECEVKISSADDKPESQCTKTEGMTVCPSDTDVIILGSSFESEKHLQDSSNTVKVPACVPPESAVDVDQDLSQKRKQACSSRLRNKCFHSQGQHLSQADSMTHQKLHTADLEDDDLLMADMVCALPHQLPEGPRIHVTGQDTDENPGDRVASVCFQSEAPNSPSSFSSDDEIQLLELKENHLDNQGIHRDSEEEMKKSSLDNNIAARGSSEMGGNVGTETGDHVDAASVASDCDLFEDEIDVSLLPSTPQVSSFKQHSSPEKLNRALSDRLSIAQQSCVNQASVTGSLYISKSPCGQDHSQKLPKRKSSEVDDAQSERGSLQLSSRFSPLPKRQRQMTSASEGNFPSFSMSAVECSTQISNLSSPVPKEFKTSTPQSAGAQSFKHAARFAAQRLQVDDIEKADARKDAITSGSYQRESVSGLPSSVHRVTCVGETLSPTTPVTTARCSSFHSPLSIVEHDSLYVTPDVTFQLVTPTTSGNIKMSSDKQDQNKCLSYPQPSLEFQTETMTSSDHRQTSLHEPRSAGLSRGKFKDSSRGPTDYNTAEPSVVDSSDSDVEIVDTSLGEMHLPSPKFAAACKLPASQSSSHVHCTTHPPLPGQAEGELSHSQHAGWSSLFSSQTRCEGGIMEELKSKGCSHDVDVITSSRDTRNISHSDSRMNQSAGPVMAATSPSADFCDDVWEGFEDVDAYNPDLPLNQDLSPGNREEAECDLEDQEVHRYRTRETSATMAKEAEQILSPAARGSKMPETPVDMTNSPESTPVNMSATPDTPTRSLVHLARHMHQYISSEKGSEGETPCSRLSEHQRSPRTTNENTGILQLCANVTRQSLQCLPVCWSPATVTTLTTPIPQLPPPRLVSDCNSTSRKSSTPSLLSGEDHVDDRQEADVSFLWAEENAPDADNLGPGNGQHAEHEAQLQAITPKEPRQVLKTKKTGKAWVPPSPFTPMPAYDDMTTPYLKREVQKFGLKPLGKKRMRVVLKDIYHKTHQYETDSEYEDADVQRSGQVRETAMMSSATNIGGLTEQRQPGSSNLSDANPPRAKKTKRGLASPKGALLISNKLPVVKRTAGTFSASDVGPDQRKPKKTKRGLASGTANVADPSQQGLPAPQEPCATIRRGDMHSQTSQIGHSALHHHGESDVSDYCSSPEKSMVSSSQDSDCSERPDMSRYEEADTEEDDEDNLTPSQQPNFQDLKQTLMQFIQSHPELHVKVLTYEPLDLGVLRADLKEAGVRCSQQKLLDFLDEMCITFTTKNDVSGKSRQRNKARRGPKLKKLAAASQK